MIAKIINEDQVGYIKGRYIAESVRKIFDILNYTDYNDKEAIIAQIDLEKALFHRIASPNQNP